MPSTTPTASPWVCATCGATTTDQGRDLMGPRCWLCSGTLFRADELDADGVPIDGNARCRACGSPVDADAWPNGCPNGPHTLEEYEGGRR